MRTEQPVAGKPVAFYTIPGDRWVFAGCRNPSGYATVADAHTEALLQATNQYSGSLNTGPVDPADHRRAVATLRKVGAR